MKNPFKEDNGYSDVITKVHTEFATAGDKLYAEAVAILNSINLLNEDKVKRLKKLGFVATPEVRQAEEVIAKRKLNADTVKTVKYYREQYPLQKFITETQVKEICKKYGLIYGKVSSYVGFVPESKLKLMEDFVLKEKDACYYLSNPSWGLGGREGMPISYEEYLSCKRDGSSRAYMDNQFLIAAPAKDFNVSAREEIKDFKITNKPVPDPVVLAPVKGGYLIVAAWGEEASDPLVVNDITN